jgi:hypothetical protein
MIEYASESFRKFEESVRFWSQTYKEEPCFTALESGLQFGAVPGYPGWVRILEQVSQRSEQEVSFPSSRAGFSELLRLLCQCTKVYSNVAINVQESSEFTLAVNELVVFTNFWREHDAFPIRWSSREAFISDLNKIGQAVKPTHTPVESWVRQRMKMTAAALEAVQMDGSQAAFVNLKSLVDPGVSCPIALDRRSDVTLILFTDIQKGILNFLRSKQLELICPIAFSDRFDGRFHEVHQGSFVELGALVVKTERYGLKYQDHVVQKALVVCGDVVEARSAWEKVSVEDDVDDSDGEPATPPNF